jgi:hypothetical protein
MKHDKIQTRPAHVTIAPHAQDVQGITPATENSLFRWLALAAMVGVCAGAIALFMLPDLWKRDARGTVKSRAEGKRWKPQPWEPATADDGVIDRFFTLRKAGDKKALELLGPAAVFDDEPVSEKTAAARQTDFCLRSDLQLRDIWRGEPDGNGGQRSTARCYTIVTKGNASSPPLNIRTNRGIQMQVQEHLSSPDLVVEVRDGKVYGVRTELHMGP